MSQIMVYLGVSQKHLERLAPKFPTMSFICPALDIMNTNLNILSEFLRLFLLFFGGFMAGKELIKKPNIVVS